MVAPAGSFASPAQRPGDAPPVPLTIGGNGFLALTTTQRTAWTPTVSIVVFDITLGEFFSWNTASPGWTTVTSPPTNPLPVGTAFAGPIIEGPITLVTTPNYDIKLTDAALLVLAGPIGLPEIGTGAGMAVEGTRYPIYIYPTATDDVDIEAFAGQTFDIAGPGPLAMRAGARLVVRATLNPTATWIIEESTAGETIRGPMVVSLPAGSYVKSFGVQMLAGVSRSLKALWLACDAPITAGTLTLAAAGVGGTTLAGFSGSLIALSTADQSSVLPTDGPGNATATTGASSAIGALVEFKVTAAGLAGPTRAWLVAEWY